MGTRCAGSAVMVPAALPRPLHDGDDDPGAGIGMMERRERVRSRPGRPPRPPV